MRSPDPSVRIFLQMIPKTSVLNTVLVGRHVHNTSSLDLNRISFSGIFNFRNRRKSYGAYEQMKYCVSQEFFRLRVGLFALYNITKVTEDFQVLLSDNECALWCAMMHHPTANEESTQQTTLLRTYYAFVLASRMINVSIVRTASCTVSQKVTKNLCEALRRGLMMHHPMGSEENT
ncbi:hypothetical protein TNCV_3572741 [Trichonephila clavipes]|nr:hypothetical protein TNCV_3572741 [Trichonephila clavipes]